MKNLAKRLEAAAPELAGAAGGLAASQLGPFTSIVAGMAAKEATRAIFNRTVKKQPATRKTMQRKRPPKSGATADYSRRSAPTARGTRVKQSLSANHVVRHSQPLGVISATQSTFYGSLRQVMNPGMPAYFPYAAPIAQRYQFYRFRGARLRYVPSCPTTTPGLIWTYWEYNPNESMASDFVDAMSQQGATQSPSWQEVVLELNMASVRMLTSGQGGWKNVEKDISVTDTYNDTAVLYFGYDGVDGAAIATPKVLGSLYLEYTVELSTPNVSPTKKTARTVGSFLATPGAQMGAAHYLEFTDDMNTHGWVVPTVLGAGTALTVPEGPLEVYVALQVIIDPAETINVTLEQDGVPLITHAEKGSTGQTSALDLHAVVNPDLPTSFAVIWQSSGNASTVEPPSQVWIRRLL